MKTENLIQNVRKSAAYERQFTGLRTSRRWPLCQTCGREVEAVELKNINSHSIELWAKHHGKEDFMRIEFPYRIEGDPLVDEQANAQIRQAMTSAVMFDPYKIR